MNTEGFLFSGDGVWALVPSKYDHNKSFVIQFENWTQMDQWMQWHKSITPVNRELQKMADQLRNDILKLYVSRLKD